MTARRATVATLLLLLLAALVWFLRPGPAADAPGGGPAEGGAFPAGTATPPPPAPAPRSTLADALNAPAGDIHADLRLVLEIIEAFRTNFPRDGNPVGDNPEITAALTGRNRLRLALIPPDHPAVNRTGELCDRWGTPFFFHAESATRMSVRSAGPDRRLWSADDIVLDP